jgi:hypothetical protein
MMDDLTGEGQIERLVVIGQARRGAGPVGDARIILLGAEERFRRDIATIKTRERAYDRKTCAVRDKAGKCNQRSGTSCRIASRPGNCKRPGDPLSAMASSGISGTISSTPVRDSSTIGNDPCRCVGILSGGQILRDPSYG